MNKLLLLTAFFIFSTKLFAQNYELSGKIADAETGIPIIGATIFLSNDSVKTGGVSLDKGMFKINAVPRGTYQMQIKFIGYENIDQIIRVRSSQDLGILKMKSAAEQLDGVDIVAKSPIGTTKGDTSEFRASAFKTTENASAKDLIEKMPGVQSSGGTVKAQGEQVTQVLVDGKPFFGQDVNTALNTLPAQVVDKIQVFDDQSEESKGSGVDDGTRIKTVNIVTKVDMRNGEFGKLYAGGGSNERYNAGANINIFRGDRRISLLTQFNNINIQNFSGDDLLGAIGDNSGGRGPSYMRGFSVGSEASDFMVNPRNGIVNTSAAGLNYQDVLSDKVEISGSYFYNRAVNTAQSNTYRLYYIPDSEGQEYNEIDSAEANNHNHRMNIKMVYKINEKASLFLLPNISAQQNEGETLLAGITSGEGAVINELHRVFNSDLKAFNWSNDVMFRQNFNKKGRSFFVRVKAEQNRSEGENFLYALNSDSDSLDQYGKLQNREDEWRGSLMYSEPLNDRGLGLYFTYFISNEPGRSDKKIYNFQDGSYSSLDTSLYNVSDNGWLSQTAGVGLRKFDKNGGFVVNARFEHSSLSNEQEFPTNTIITSRPYLYFRPFALYRKKLKNNASFFVMYRAYTDEPRVSQLQNVVDNSNPLQLRKGNKELDIEYGHSFRLRYNHSNTAKSTVFFANLGASYSGSYIGSSTYTALTETQIEEVELSRGMQLTVPVNLNNYSRFNAFVTYGFFVNSIKSNLNINISGNLNNTPSLINGIQANTRSENYGMGLVLTSNISKNIDFNISTESAYNTISNSLNSNLNNSYFIQVSRIKYNWIMPKGFTFRTNLEHQRYFGLSAGLNNKVLLWTAGIGKQMLKNNRGEIQLNVFDILQQNNQISQNFYDSYYEEGSSNVLTRYVMVSFVYNLRKFRSDNNKPEE